MNALGIFVKHPVAGEVKTRLAASIGATQAARLYEAFVADIVERFRRTADIRFLCHSPDTEYSIAYFHDLARNEYQLWPQPATDLGSRLQVFVEHARRIRAKRTVIIGSDSPTLPEDRVLEAFDLLETRDCVLGPATDGGYYLIGLSRTAVSKLEELPGSLNQLWPIFENISWSTPHVLNQTVERIRSWGGTLGVLPPWYDVDTVEDLSRLRSDPALRSSGIGGSSFHYTATALAGVQFNDFGP